MSAGEKTTIEILARELGLATSTVSRALNHYTDIAPETRRRVQEAAQKAGYRLSTARRRKWEPTNAIGIVVEASSLDITSPFLVQFLRGATLALAKQGFDLVVASSDGPAEALEVYERLIADRSVDGFILTRVRRNDRRVSLLSERQIPFVLFGRDAMPEEYSWLDVDAAGAMRESLEHLADLGHRRVATIHGPGAINFMHMRAQAYKDSLRRLGLESDPELMVDGGLTPETGAKATRTLLRLDRPPTAIVCDLDCLAIGAMSALHTAGIEPGKDISVIGYGDDPYSEFAVPPLTTFNQHAETDGRWVAEMILAQLAGVSPQILQRERRAVLVRRKSTAAPSGTPEQLRKKTMKDDTHTN